MSWLVIPWRYRQEAEWEHVSNKTSYYKDYHIFTNCGKSKLELFWTSCKIEKTQYPLIDTLVLLTCPWARHGTWKLLQLGAPHVTNKPQITVWQVITLFFTIFTGGKKIAFPNKTADIKVSGRWPRGCSSVCRKAKKKMDLCLVYLEEPGADTQESGAQGTRGRRTTVSNKSPA